MRTPVKIIAVLLFTGIVAAALVYFFVYNKPHPDYEKLDADFTLPVEELYKTYSADKTKAGSRYNGKVIVVTGKLSRVETSDSLIICVFVFNKGMFGDEGVRLTMLPKNGSEALKLSPGTEVKLKGYCTGFNDSDVILEKSSIVNH